MKLKISTWADIMWVVTILYGIFVICFYCIEIPVEGIKGIDSLTLAERTSIFYKPLKGFRLHLLIAGCFAISWIIDKCLINWVWVRFTKAHKLEKYKVAKEYKAMQEEKNDNKKD